MNTFIPILLAAAFMMILAFAVVFILPRVKHGVSGFKLRQAKTQEAAIREANKRLVQNPRDATALNFLGDVYFEQHDWDKAYQTYALLSELPVVDRTFDPVQANLRGAQAAMALENNEAAYKLLVIARSINPNNPQVNFEIGYLEFKRGNYEKAVPILQKSVSSLPDDARCLRTLGHALFKLKRPKEAMSYIRRAMDTEPDDKESLFTLAECYAEAGQRDQALRIYSHLRPDEVWGPRACLASGLLNFETNQNETAIADFEIGLKHKNIDENIEIELKYQLGKSYLKAQDIQTAMSYLHQVKALHSNYRDVNELSEKYEELSTNRNLQIFTMASSADFVALCRKIVMTYFNKAKVKITKTSVTGNEWADIVAEVDTSKWSSVVMFRFIRTQGPIGELVVRDFHSHLKETKADKGICAGVGIYSSDARRFTETRLIDLLDRARLVPILSMVDSKLLQSATAAASK